MIKLESIEQKSASGQTVGVNVADNKVSITGLEYVGRESDTGKSVIVAETRGAQPVAIKTSNGKTVMAKLQIKLYVKK